MSRTSGARSEADASPRSATSFPVNLAGLAGALGAVFLLRTRGWPDEVNVLLVLAAAALPIVVLDCVLLKVHRRPSTGLAWARASSPPLGRVLLKLLGAAASVGFVAFLYWALPEYHGSFYGPFFGLVRRTWRWGVCALVVYFWIVDGLLANPKDVYWQIGKALTGSPGVLRGDALALHLRALLVKAFFLPLMTVYLAKELRGLGALHIGLESLTSFGLYDIVWSFVFAFDLVFAVVGYVLSLRVLDTHVRSAEPTALGWAVTLLCYEPFLSLVTRRYLTYDAPLGFADWLEDVPGLRVVWAAAVVGLILVYLLSTVAFGCRFSNLTHRGIITGGPYRFTKHPAYLAKNLAWWLVAVPFIPDGGAQAALRRCLLLLGFNLLYFLRARTEERHLSRDPDYVRYALWMNDHGLLRALGRHVPALRYTPPTSAPPTSQPS